MVISAILLIKIPPFPVFFFKKGNVLCTRVKQQLYEELTIHMFLVTH